MGEYARFISSRRCAAARFRHASVSHPRPCGAPTQETVLRAHAARRPVRDRGGEAGRTDRPKAQVPPRSLVWCLPVAEEERCQAATLCRGEKRFFSRSNCLQELGEVAFIFQVEKVISFLREVAVGHSIQRLFG